MHQEKDIFKPNISRFGTKVLNELSFKDVVTLRGLKVKKKYLK